MLGIFMEIFLFLRLLRSLCIKKNLRRHWFLLRQKSKKYNFYFWILNFVVGVIIEGFIYLLYHDEENIIDLVHLNFSIRSKWYNWLKVRPFWLYWWFLEPSFGSRNQSVAQCTKICKIWGKAALTASYIIFF